jgi:2-iminobutanoate/2-iminopropanoate deaminase
MSELSVIQTDRAPAALGPYSQAIVSGDWVFCSGQIPIVPATGELLEGVIADQTERVLTNLSEVLAAAGSSLDRVVKTTVFLAHMGDFAAMNEVYARRFGSHRPARSTIQAGALPRGCKIEIECVARRGT